MDGKGQTLNWFTSEKISLEIPFFQRPYVWDEPEWEELISSISNANDECMPFLGSFILQKTEIKNRYLIIDGQQRITTLSVFIKAYVDHFYSLPSDSIAEFLNIIYEKHMSNLVSSYTPRLTPSNIDEPSFKYVMDKNLKLDDVDNHNDDRIINAYKYFRDYFVSNDINKNMEIGAKILTNNKFFISIVLEEEDDEQKIFDSVNTLGRDLTNSDIIKNYLFQKLKAKANGNKVLENQVLKDHQDYWMDKFYSGNKREFWEKEKILGRIKTNNIESFLKDYATVKKIYIPSETGGIDGLAKSYKEHIIKLGTFNNIENFIKEIAEYADVYYDYSHEYETVGCFKIGDVVNTTLLILDKTETSTFNPYIMKVLKEKPENYIELFENLQKFLVQRLIYKAKTKNYNKVCENLLDSTDPIKYLTQYNENEPMGLNEYPQGLKRIKNKPATLILFLVELIRRKGEEEMYSDTLLYNKSLEHLIPQDWKKWVKVPCYRIKDGLSGEKDEDYEIISNINDVNEHRKNMIYSIGNMTLLKGPLNTRISNETIKTKIEGNDKYEGIRKFVGSMSIAQEVVDTYDCNPSWDERNIYKRNVSIFNELNNYYNFLNKSKKN